MIYNGQSLTLATSVDAAKRRWRKQLIYTGSFIKKVGDKEEPFQVTENTLVHWKNTFDRMNVNGVQVPVPEEHSELPSKRRGTLVGLELSTNDKGLPALFGIVEFNDEESERQFKNSNVSVYVPDKPFYDGFGNEYIRPIKHVALTDYPVINGLGNFSLVASFSDSEQTPEKKVVTMDVKTLATKLGLDPESPDVEKLVSDAIDAMIEEIKKTKEKPAVPDSGASTTTPAPAASASTGTPAKISPVMLSMVKDSRETKIDALLQGNQITSNVAKFLKDTYLSETALQGVGLALSNGVEANDGFDNAIKSHSMNEKRVNTTAKTGAQLPDPMKLSNSGNSIATSDNPLIANCEKIAAEYKQRTT